MESIKHYKIGYTQGVYDLFHVGHLNLINQAKLHCDILIVGVNTDALVEKYKGKKPVISENDRCIIIRNLKAVDEAVLVSTLDKVEVLKEHHFDAVFIGSDWKGNERWNKTEEDLRQYGVDVVYLPYTEGVSTTLIQKKLLP